MLPTPPDVWGRLTSEAFDSHIAETKAKLQADKHLRDKLGEASRACADRTARYFHQRQLGHKAARALLDETVTDLASLLESVAGDTEMRTSSVGGAVQAVCAAQCFEAFLCTGTLGCRPAAVPGWTPKAPAADSDADMVPPNTATEYEPTDWIAGMISASHEIGRYAANRATAGDVASVQAAQAVTSSLLDSLMAFDFRNGPLRKSFDSLKYVVRRLEDTIYELSIHRAAVDDNQREEAKDARVDKVQLDAARASYEAADELREASIKKCREVQKLSKQAIFSLQREDLARASKQLDDATALAKDILQEMAPPHGWLRLSGFVHSMLEELVEGRLLECWMRDPHPRSILLRSELCFAELSVDPVEYFGGLGDLVGEIGRVAVRRATNRDKEAVADALGTALAVQSAVLDLGSLWPRRLENKTTALRTAVKKMEQLRYELNLVQYAKRRTLDIEWQNDPEAVQDAARDDDAA